MENTKNNKIQFPPSKNLWFRGWLGVRSRVRGWEWCREGENHSFSQHVFTLPLKCTKNHIGEIRTSNETTEAILRRMVRWEHTGGVPTRLTEPNTSRSPTSLLTWREVPWRIKKTVVRPNTGLKELTMIKETKPMGLKQSVCHRTQGEVLTVERRPSAQREAQLEKVHKASQRKWK